MKLKTIMKDFFGVDARDVKDTPELRRSYYLQEKLASKLKKEGKVLDKIKADIV